MNSQLCVNKKKWTTTLHYWFFLFVVFFLFQLLIIKFFTNPKPGLYREMFLSALSSFHLNVFHHLWKTGLEKWKQAKLIINESPWHVSVSVTQVGGNALQKNVYEMRNFQSQWNLPLSLQNFLEAIPQD